MASGGTYVRYVNPISHLKLSKNICIFAKIDIYSDSVWAKSTFVVSKWSHNVTWKSGCFQAAERGEFSKNSSIVNSWKLDHS